MGKKTIIDPIPPIIPSKINDLNNSDEFDNEFSIKGVNVLEIKLSNISERGPPIQEKVILKIRKNIRIRIGTDKNLS